MVRAAPIIRKHVWLVGLAVWLCACSNVHVENWKIKTDACVTKVTQHGAVSECRKRLGADRLRRGVEFPRGTAADPGSTPGASTIQWDEEGNRR